MFRGTYTAIVTPFRKGKVDLVSLGKLIEHQIKGGVTGVVPMGTTGESPTLSFKDHIHVVQQTVRMTKGRVKVIAGTGANCTEEAIELTQAAEKAGVDGSLQVAPYYNKPTQEGLFQHFQKIAKSTRLPIMLYSIPGRCGIEIAVETVRRLAAACPNIVSIKEAGGNVDRVSQLRQALPPKFTILCGDDSLTVPFMSVGAVGVVSVASNLIPAEVSQLVSAFGTGRTHLALEIHEKYYPLFKDLFIETNPAPIKAALAAMGIGSEEVRLPLVAISSSGRKQLFETLKSVGLASANRSRKS